jgi:translation initiation factor 2B subunit (eIF-2B alpha/beta/delta family)
MFVKERIVFANQIIRDTAAKKIQEGDVIMTFGK